MANMKGDWACKLAAWELAGLAVLGLVLIVVEWF